MCLQAGTFPATVSHVRLCRIHGCRQFRSRTATLASYTPQNLGKSESAKAPSRSSFKKTKKCPSSVSRSSVNRSKGVTFCESMSPSRRRNRDASYAQVLHSEAVIRHFAAERPVHDNAHVKQSTAPPTKLRLSQIRRKYRRCQSRRCQTHSGCRETQRIAAKTDKECEKRRAKRVQRIRACVALCQLDHPRGTHLHQTRPKADCYGWYL
jgi:hypothetical protein